MRGGLVCFRSRTRCWCSYSTEGFIEKNKDCDRNVTDLLSLSTNDFIQKLISGKNCTTTAATRGTSCRFNEGDRDGLRWRGLAGVCLWAYVGSAFLKDERKVSR